LDNAVLQRPAFASLEVEDFRDDRNMLIFATMLCLARQGREIDLVSVAYQLHHYGELRNAGGAPYLASLVDLLDRV
jgi:replicative DNA helicase